MEDQNDVGLAMLLNKEADAIWIYADQADNYKCDEGADQDKIVHNCEMWSRFGKEFAYIHTGMFGVVYDGTTVAFTKKGAGLVELLNPCIDEFLETEAFYDICLKHGLEGTCKHNQFFPKGDKPGVWTLQTSELKDAG